MQHKCYNAHKAFIHIALPYPQEISYVRAYRPHYQSILKFNNVQTIFSSQKTVKTVLFAIYLRKGNILHGKNQRCNYGTKERGSWHYF